MGVSRVLGLWLAVASTSVSAAGHWGDYAGSSTIIGQTSTATIASNGDPRYIATDPKYSGVVQLQMVENGGTYYCSGSLLPDRISVLTAGHCVSSGQGVITTTKTTAYFYNGGNPDTVVYTSPEATAVSVGSVYVNSGYTGQVMDQNDIAIVRLSDYAPDFARSYELYDGSLSGQVFNVAGYGRRSDVGGAIGADLGIGRLRQGYNRYEFRFGDPAFNGWFDGVLVDPDKPAADTTYTWVSDFDNGTDATDAACLISKDAGVTDGRFCDVGLGTYEVGIAPGDSGGPEFVDGKIASISSFGLTFYELGDYDKSYDASWGELNGFVPTSLHADWIRAVMGVPEPSSWALMIGGLGATGFSMRRRRSVAVRFA